MSELSLTLSASSETERSLEALRAESKTDELSWFTMTFYVGAMMSRLGPQRAADFFTDVIAAMRALQGSVSVDGGAPEEIIP